MQDDRYVEQNIIKINSHDLSTIETYAVDIVGMYTTCEVLANVIVKFKVNLSVFSIAVSLHMVKVKQLLGKV